MEHVRLARVVLALAAARELHKRLLRLHVAEADDAFDVSVGPPERSHAHLISTAHRHQLLSSHASERQRTAPECSRQPQA